jgi:hypothetical protein
VLYALLEYCTAGDSSTYRTPEHILGVLLQSRIVRVKGRKAFVGGSGGRSGTDPADSGDGSSSGDEDSDEDDEVVPGVTNPPLSALARTLSRAYCANRLATTANTVKRMNTVQRQPLQHLQLQPQDVVLLSTTDTSAAKAMERLRAAQAGGPSKLPGDKKRCRPCRQGRCRSTTTANR